MNIKTLYCKLHNAICTESRLDYMGSITIDRNWMEAAKIHDDQAVDVLNINNGSRITTYAIAGKRGSGVICLNGAAAHHFDAGDRVIIIAYCHVTLEQKQNFQPTILLFSEHPPYEINQEERKLRWLKEIPQYSLLPQENPATTYDSLDALSNNSPQCDRPLSATFRDRQEPLSNNKVLTNLDNIHSLNDFRENTTSYLNQLKTDKNPLLLTVNGEAVVIVEDIETFQNNQNRLQELEKEVQRLKDEILQKEMELVR